jgi:hypothetical protein
MARFTRRENPPVYSNYRRYKSYLRRDFLLRCVYCERTEEYLGGEEAFEVEHFKPTAKFPELICVYSNLYYACRPCNGHKSQTWPSAEQIAQGYRFADPCVEDLHLDHLQERADGGIDGKTACGTYSSAHIRLDRPELRRWRRLRKQAQEDLPKLREMDAMLKLLVAFSRGTDREEVEGQLAALARRIEESRLRFSID